MNKKQKKDADPNYYCSGITRNPFLSSCRWISENGALYGAISGNRI